MKKKTIIKVDGKTYKQEVGKPLVLNTIDTILKKRGLKREDVEK